jgi:hypothetical protein
VGLPWIVIGVLVGVGPVEVVVEVAVVPVVPEIAVDWVGGGLWPVIGFV